MIELPIFYIAAIISVAGLLLATYTDLKQRIVPNKLNYGLAIIGLILFGAQSLIDWTFWPITLSIFGLCYGFLFGWIMWKAGVFAGGDVKLFMGLGALNPFTPILIKTTLFNTATIPLFPITLFIYSLICFLPYGIAVLAYKVYKNKKFQKELLAEMKPKVLEALHTAIFTSAAFVIIYFTKIITFSLETTAIIIVVVILWGLLKSKKKFVTIAAIIIAAIINAPLLIQALIATILVSVILYSLLKLLLSAKRILSVEIAVKDLEEGMIPAASLIKKGNKIISVESFSYKRIIEYAKNRNFSAISGMLAPKKEIISARKARGLDDDELKLIKKMAKEGKIPKKIFIKESMPFVPTMLLGYLLCLIIGDFVIIMALGGLL